MVTLRKRENAFKAGEDWPETTLWYARAVKAMKARAFRETTSWRFYAAIHGVSGRLWNTWGILEPGDAPSQDDFGRYINQCQHQSWYFVPWHRGYLLALERILIHEIRLLNGPHETWALPYWNYFVPGQTILPPAFTSRDWPDGTGDNPLFVEQRYGEIVTQPPFDVGSVTTLDSMSDPDFFGPGGGATAGFGGPLTAFNWNSGTNGALELNPHNAVHGLVGGEHPSLIGPTGAPLPGLMGTPTTAALDPIFYLHHCNIDRLWESWNKFPAGKTGRKPTDWKNPTLPLWLEGPVNVGQHEFAMPNADGTKWVYTPGDVLDVAGLGYEYDDLSPGAPVSVDVLADRLVTLGIPVERAAEAEALTLASPRNVEMIGAAPGLRLVGSASIRASVPTMPSVRSSVVESLGAAADRLPDRVFLNLENVTGLSDAAIVKIYVGSPNYAGLGGNAEFFAGSISTFGLSQASDPNGPHIGDGITYTLEITKIVDRLHLRGEFDVDDLAIAFVPLRSIPEASDIRIGRISLYRQSG